MNLETRAAELAAAHVALRRAPRKPARLLDLPRASAAIARATTGFRQPRSGDTPFQKAAAWFLDNHYLVARSLRQIATEIPRGFRRRLPSLLGDDCPRILRVAEVLVEATRLDFDETALLAFVDAYQLGASLAIAELWALPAMLRVAAIGAMIRDLDGFFAPALVVRPALDAWEALLEPGVVVERAVRTLRLLGDIDWRTFIQRTSAVESALRKDPAGIYGRMDFESRDAYRKAVESLAWGTDRTELEVAGVAVAMATEGLTRCSAADRREGHVGYYLIDGGRGALQARIAFQPAGVERLRGLVLSWPTLSYLGSIGALALALLAIAITLVAKACGIVVAGVEAVFLVVPGVSVAVAITNHALNRLIAPRLLAKLDFAGAVPADCKTAVVIPALVDSTTDCERLLAQLELHYLSCPDPALLFALLTDRPDAPQILEDGALLAHVRTVVEALNTKYAPGAVGPFHVLHREARWSAGERCFMGWERKRGKLEELNRLLRGDAETSYKHHVGNRAALEDVRFVLTLDADTQLPLGAARKLIGLAAHPLNTARFDAVTGRVTAGFTVAQPRVEASPAEGTHSIFSRVLCGDTALDIYTRAASDVYQDLFGAGAYVGKGIYEIDTFARSLAGRMPSASIASHDLIEGIQGRAALVSDVVVFEQYPQGYLSFARRMHRWIRGDWQLLPWLLPTVPSATAKRMPNRLSVIDRWKILDNLRRSLLAPDLLALVLLTWFFTSARVSSLVIAPLLFPLLIAGPSLLGAQRREALGRWVLGVCFLPAEAWIATDAIVRALARMAVTRRHLLQWVTAADTARAYAEGTRRLFWREMGPPVVGIAVIGCGLAVLRPGGIAFGAPLLVVWLLSPEIARWVSHSERATRSLSPSEAVTLRHLARRTWLFFETFVGPSDQWLVPDNYQDEPGGIVAHRTSPTNIGLMLIAELSAYDLGYIGRAELTVLVHNSLETLNRLERYRGHWLNWYNTRTLEPLLPRYVSTVDSGNLDAALLTLAQGCRDAAFLATVRPVRFLGLGDTLDLLDQSLGRLGVPIGEASASIAALRTILARALAHVEDAVEVDAAAHALSSELLRLEAALLALFERTSAERDVATFREVQTWLDRFRHQTRSLHGDLSRRPADSLRDELLALADRVDQTRAGTDYTFLFDEPRKLFHIGYNATSDRLDANHYDLLASEARLASFLAVVQMQVPPEHWFTLGRPVTRIHGKAALLSWGGTMFEFLMPTLFMRGRQHTLLQQSEELAVVAQIDRGAVDGLPWGVSESGYAQLDAQNNYQYRSFGVPGLGLRRGMEDDHVVAPYASVLALPFRPREVVRNLEVLSGIGASGLYGLYEAVDYDQARALETSRVTARPVRDHAVVRSHMAHHQGMILAALNNALNDDVLVGRFHANMRVRTGETLLSERLPPLRVADDVAKPARVAPETRRSVPKYSRWIPSSDSVQVALLGNGRLLSAVTDSGAGFTSWNGLAVTRGGIDAAGYEDGTWIYLRDEESGRLWSSAPAPTRARVPSDEVSFSAHQVDFHHRDEGLSVRTEITLGTLEDVEVRRVTLHNESDRARVVTMMTFAEPALESRAASAGAPAFSRLFIECEVLPTQHGVVASRRLRSPTDAVAVMVQSLVWDDPAVSWIGAQTDRRAFLGRRHDARAPLADLTESHAGNDRTRLDPAIVLAVRVELAAHARVDVALVTTVAKSRDAALDLARRFGSLRAARWVAHDAEIECARRLDGELVSPSLLPQSMAILSRLLAPSLTLRAGCAEISGPQPAKNGLWGYGISGDDPLLVVRVRSQAGNALIKDVLSTYRFLRLCGQKVEIVFLDDALTGYQAEDTGSVRNVIETSGAAAWLNQRGGLFVLATDQLGPSELARLQRAACVLLDSNKSLAEQLSTPPGSRPPLPFFAATRPIDVGAPIPTATPKLMFETPYGGFREDGREFVIHARAGQSTPAPWCNVLANADAGCLVSESSLGCTWAGNSGENRLTPWRNDPVTDVPSEALYLRDEETAEVWSPTPLPAGMDVDILVRHGAGYTTYERESHGLRHELTIFVPPDAPVKIARLTLTNRLARPRRLTATYYAEWVLGARREEQQAHIVCALDATAQVLLARCGWNVDFAERVAFLAADRTLHGFTFDRTEFLGRGGSLAQPEALRRWGLSGSTGDSSDPCAALQTHLELAPGETATTHFVLGQGRDGAQASELARRFQSRAEVEKALQSVHEHWDRVLGSLQVKTPEPAMDLLLNRWLLYQSLSSRILGRTAFYQSSGAFGYRDQLQDVMALVHGAPEIARAQILASAAHQFEEGDVLHWWHPPADRGVRTRCSDDMAWLPYVTSHYVEATGDTAILDETIPFLKAATLTPEEHDRYAQFSVLSEPATLRAHCSRALTRALTEGPRGLPLMGDGDWNDGMNRVGVLGKGESVWLGFFLATTMKRFARLCELPTAVKGPAELPDSAHWRERSAALGVRLDREAWDGAWYLRAFYDDGAPLGTSRALTCRIDSIAQSWAVLSDVVDPARAARALRSADDRLVQEKERLLLVLAPPFDGGAHDPGYIQAYPPGVRENGGQYTHAATWLGFAHAHAGDGERAARIFRLLNPILHVPTREDAERYRVEPYVLAGDVYGAAPLVGRGGWTWYTGAAAWMWRLGVEAILGLRKDGGGLRVEPCIPENWPGFEATVQLGEGRCHVVVDNANGSGHGVQSATLDGVAILSPFVPLVDGTATRELRIMMARTATAAA